MTGSLCTFTVTNPMHASSFIIYLGRFGTEGKIETRHRQALIHQIVTGDSLPNNLSISSQEICSPLLTGFEAAAHQGSTCLH